MTNTIITSGTFDNLCSNQVRFLHEIAKLGQVHLLLLSDEFVEAVGSGKPKFPLPERHYYLRAFRYVSRVHIITDPAQLQNIPGIIGEKADLWCILPSEESPKCRQYAESGGIGYKIVPDEQLGGFPENDISHEPTSGKRVIVTGCFDWLHSGHIRFLEKASEYGDLYVAVGNDENIKKLKGPGHPMFSQDERRYMVAAVRFVKETLISSGHGWLDAEPEIRRIKPDIYIVNEDGDKEVKRKYCETFGIEYVVLKRLPKNGLPTRISTNLRGF
ncbi:MAG TPA: adenylyltransferase/cytidyltransferase family protein [Planctomycetes bacterium]|nr:adenylyltransferase/cytidyltransferase family protein [Planctomycetota bacterium]